MCDHGRLLIWMLCGVDVSSSHTQLNLLGKWFSNLTFVLLLK